MATTTPRADTTTEDWVSLLNDTNVTTEAEEITNDDAAWALTCAFLILTMQTGFAMLECGCVSTKNIANIMVKNVVDVTVGGFSYWAFGYALSYGEPSNAFCGYGDFFFRVDQRTAMGTGYSRYFFQFSFATTATTIVSGAVAERMQLRAYIIFSFLNTVIYCVPASWVWNEPIGFLHQMHFYDFAGVTVVHLCGGTSAFVASVMLGPRMKRFEETKSNEKKYQMSSPVTSLAGMFMLWWAWLGFNCGSTFGVSKDLWKVTALVAVTTLNGSIGGGLMGLIISMATNRGMVMIDLVINSVLGGLVAITGISSVTVPRDALFIGMMGAAVAIAAQHGLVRLKIDDPVGAIPVHFFSAFLGDHLHWPIW